MCKIHLIFVLGKVSKSGSYQHVTRGHCDSSHFQMFLGEILIWRVLLLFFFQWDFLWHPENKIEEELERRIGTGCSKLIMMLPLWVTGKFKVLKYESTRITSTFLFGLRQYSAPQLLIVFTPRIFYFTVIFMSITQVTHDINLYSWNTNLHQWFYSSDFKALVTIMEKIFHNEMTEALYTLLFF